METAVVKKKQTRIDLLRVARALNLPVTSKMDKASIEKLVNEHKRYERKSKHSQFNGEK